ncbi:hypothetical protein COLO4_10959 [Corchorus olitorius]|uniref:DUF674 domain-containing protein n=1 Tax=Corchorus olitorius TaxID=93759 RepID=A0A1R3K6B7_9ROSI|nr:hypothetical protein COLO4_10959 [Corchorus olitorius]
MAETKPKLSLMIDKKANKVLFAEAGKDFVDFLFSILSLPLGTITWLLNTANMVGSIGNLYLSLQNFDESYLESDLHKNLLLKPNVPDFISGVHPLLPETGQDPVKRKFYNCFDNHRYVTDDIDAICPTCNYSMCHEVTLVGPGDTKAGSTSEGGIVKGLAKYMVMDDLSVMPMSMTYGINQLRSNVEDLSGVEERVVEFGFIERLQLMKASLNSKTALTDVFIEKKQLKVKEEEV